MTFARFLLWYGLKQQRFSLAIWDSVVRPFFTTGRIAYSTYLPLDGNAETSFYNDVCMFVLITTNTSTGHTIFNGSVFVEAENMGATMAPKAVQLRAISIFTRQYSVNIHMTFPFGNTKLKLGKNSNTIPYY